MIGRIEDGEEMFCYRCEWNTPIGTTRATRYRPKTQTTFVKLRTLRKANPITVLAKNNGEKTRKFPFVDVGEKPN